MPLNWPTSGEYSISAYQMSAIPYVTSSTISAGQLHRYDFPCITRFIDFCNTSTGSTDTIKLGFTENGVRDSVGNFVKILGGSSVNEEIRTTTLFVSCSSGTNVPYQIFCGLTNIPAMNFLALTASNGHQGVG